MMHENFYHDFTLGFVSGAVAMFLFFAFLL